MKCDDDKMSNTTTEEILKLSGGGKFSKLSQRHISSQCPDNDYKDDKKMVGHFFKSKKRCHRQDSRTNDTGNCAGCFRLKDTLFLIVSTNGLLAFTM